MSDNKLVISSTPHIRDKASISGIMQDVIIALSPACVAAAYYFGFRAIAIMIVSIATCVLTEFCFQKATKQAVTTKDLSAVVTGLLLAMNLPVSVPLWIPIVGGVFAMALVKQLFGGLGQNFMNPALAARAFLQTSYAEQMVAWSEPIRNGAGADAVTAATPLAQLAMTDMVPTSADYMNALVGNISGSLGETCAIALILGGVYLIVRKVITWHIPVIFIASFMLLTFAFGGTGLFNGNPSYEVLLGGIMIGAFFMATDYSTSPITSKGKIIMGLGCGVITFVIRNFGSYPEGVCYSILLMNLFVPLIDRFARPRVYGVKKEAAQHA